MNFLTTLLQMFGNSCPAGSCTGQAAQAASAATETASALGGISGLASLLCKLLGIGC